MPELPEVETIRRSLIPHLVGRTVQAVVVRNGDFRQPVDPEAMRERVVGQRIGELSRRGKYLLCELSGDTVLVFHLGMSGRLTVVPVDRPLDPHDHLLLKLSGRRDRPLEELRLRDPRRFGLAVVLDRQSIATSSLFAHLGPEPLADLGPRSASAPAVDGGSLHARTRRRRAPVKALLLDARLLTGVGNIYACESLYQAGIDPRTPAGKLGPKRWTRLLTAVQAVLASAIAEGGTSLDDYGDFRNGDGDPGAFQVSLFVYGREGEPCRRCGRAIRRIVQTGRSTYYCSRCQR
jgi:formamidopyrimidine-DNA glycosylase